MVGKIGKIFILKDATISNSNKINSKRPPSYCCSASQSRPAHCDPTDNSTTDFLVFPHLLEFAQTHVHCVDDAIQPRHPLSHPWPPALNLSQHQSFSMCWFFASSSQNIGDSASVLPINTQGRFPLAWLVWSPCYPNSQESPKAPQFESSMLWYIVIKWLKTLEKNK